MFVSAPASVELTRDFCEQLDKLVGPQLTLLASDICEQFTINRRISGSVESLTLPFVIALVASISGLSYSSVFFSFSEFTSNL